MEPETFENRTASSHNADSKSAQEPNPKECRDTFKLSEPAIFGLIQKVSDDLSAIGKDQKNVVQNYKFRGIDDLYNELHPLFAKHGVFSVPEVLHVERQDRATKSGGLSVSTLLTMRYTFYAADGSSFATIVIGEGSDSGDKSSSKAMTAAHKYALLQIFSIPTNDKQDAEFESPEFKGGLKANKTSSTPTQESKSSPPPLRLEEKASVPGSSASKSGSQGGGDFQIEFGKHKGKKLSDVERADLIDTIRYYQEKIQSYRPGTDFHKNCEQFLTEATSYLNAQIPKRTAS